MTTEPDESSDGRSEPRESPRRLGTGSGSSDGPASGEGAPDRGAPERTYRAHYDPGSHARLSTEVVRCVADATGDEVTSIEPLYYTIDPDLLDQFGADRPDGGSLRFTFHGRAVEVTAGGEITIEPSADD